MRAPGGRGGDRRLRARRAGAVAEGEESRSGGCLGGDQEVAALFVELGAGACFTVTLMGY
jgi:hypothetical protein